MAVLFSPLAKGVSPLMLAQSRSHLVRTAGLASRRSWKSQSGSPLSSLSSLSPSSSLSSFDTCFSCKRHASHSSAAAAAAYKASPPAQDDIKASILTRAQEESQPEGRKKRSSRKQTDELDEEEQRKAEELLKARNDMILRLSSPTGPIFDVVNPADCSRPPPLILPPEMPDQSRISKLMGQGRAYLSFYKQGIKNVFQLLKLGKQTRLAGQSRRLTRSEVELVVRAAASRRRVPFFAIFLLLAGEWLPLIVPFITPLVPGPCLLPSQISTQVSRSTDVRARISAFWTPSLEGSPSVEALLQDRVRRVRSSVQQQQRRPHQQSRVMFQSAYESVLLLTYLGRMSRRWVSFLEPRGGQIPLVPTIISGLFLSQTRLWMALDSIARDDVAFWEMVENNPDLAELDQHDAVKVMVQALLPAEVVAACLARGITASPAGPQVVADTHQMRELLVRWLMATRV